MLLWTAARAYGSEERAAWEGAANISKQLATKAADQLERARKLATCGGVVLLTAVVSALLWVLIPTPPFVVDPLFQGTGWLDKVIGYTLQLGGFALVIFVIFALAKIRWSLRHVHVPMLRMFAGGASYLAPFLAVMPSFAIYRGWMKMPHSHLMPALYDGLFAGGFVLIPIVLMIAISAIAKSWHDERNTWDDPRLAFLYEAMSALEGILPPLPGSPDPLHRVVERMLQENEKWWQSRPDLIEKFRGLQDATDLESIKRTAEARWWLFRGQIRGHKVPNPLFSALAEFLWIFHPNNSLARDEWGETQLMTALASHLRNAAHCVQVFGRCRCTGEPIQDCWQQRVCEERAAFLRSLQRGALLPRADTRAYLLNEIKRAFITVLQNEWGNMALIEMPNVPRLPWWRNAVGKAKALLVGLLPLAAVYGLSDKLSALPGTLHGTLWTAAVLWLLVNLLTLLDERFAEKFSAAKEVFGAFSLGKGKE